MPAAVAAKKTVERRGRMSPSRVEPALAREGEPGRGAMAGIPVFLQRKGNHSASDAGSSLADSVREQSEMAGQNDIPGRAIAIQRKPRDPASPVAAASSEPVPTRPVQGIPTALRARPVERAKATTADEGTETEDETTTGDEDGVRSAAGQAGEDDAKAAAGSIDTRNVASLGASRASGMHLPAVSPGQAGKAVPTPLRASGSAGGAQRAASAPSGLIARRASARIARDPEDILELTSRSASEPLSPEVAARYGAMFRHQLEHVRIHTDAPAHAAAEQLAARAFAIEEHVFLPFAPTPADAADPLLAHELAHVVQHDRRLLGNVAPRVSEPGDAMEREADLMGEAALMRDRAQVRAPSDGAGPTGAPSPTETAPMDRARAGPSPATTSIGRPAASAAILRSAQGVIGDESLDVIGITQNGTSVWVHLRLAPDQYSRFVADAALADRLATDVEAALQPGRRPRMESAAFLGSYAITARIEADLPGWLSGASLTSTIAFLDNRERVLRNLRFIAPLELFLSGQGIEPGTIDWVTVVPTLLAQPDEPAATSLVDASANDRYRLFLRAVGVEAQSRSTVVGAVPAPATLGATLRSYVQNLAPEVFGDALSAFSESFLARWALQIRDISYVPDGFDLSRFDPSGAEAELERERHRVLDEFQRTRAPNLVVQYVRDNWAVSGQSEDGFLAHLDMQSVRAFVVSNMVEDLTQLARRDPAYRAAFQNTARQQARYQSLRTLLVVSNRMQASNADLVTALVDTPLSSVDPWQRQIAEDPQAYFEVCAAIGRFTSGVFSGLQNGGSLAAAFENLGATPVTRAFGSVAALVAVFTHMQAMRDLRDQQTRESRADMLAELHLRYDDVVRIVQTMWDDAETFINDVYIPKLKEVALRMVTQNRNELAHWLYHWDTETPALTANYRVAAWVLDDIARKLETGEVSSVELQGRIMTIEDVSQLRDAATTMRALSARLESPEGAEEKKQELRDAVEAFDSVRENIEDEDYPPYSWGPAVSTVARAELGIGEFPEYTTYYMIFTGRVAASANPFIARAIQSWRFREILAEEMWQFVKALALGLLTVASLLAPGVAGLILTALDIIANVTVSAFAVADASRALDLALLDPHLDLQGITVAQAREALHNAKIGLILSIVIPVGLAALLGLLIWRGMRGASRFAELEHLSSALRADPVTTERLLQLVNDPVELNRLLGLAGEARRLDGIILFSGDVARATRLLDMVPDAVKLASWLEDAGSGERLINLLDRVPNVETLDRLIGAYGSDFTTLRAHLIPLGTDAGAAVRLDALIGQFTGVGPLIAAVDRCEDIVQLERLAARVPEAERLTNLLEQVGGGNNLERLLVGASLEEIDALLLYDIPAADLVRYVESAGGGAPLLSILEHVPSIDVLDGLALSYGDDLINLGDHLRALGPGPAAAGRLQGILSTAGDVGTMQRLLGYCRDLPELEAVLLRMPEVEQVEPLLAELGGARTSALIENVGADVAQIRGFLANVGGGDATAQVAFLAAMDADPAAATALARAMQGNPGLVGRLAQQLGGDLTATIVPEAGLVTIAGELPIAPARLAAMTDADLAALLRVCENPRAPEVAADLARFEGNPTRFRFRSRVAARTEPWIGQMLTEIGVNPAAPEAQIFTHMSDADGQALWLISGEGTRGADPRVRPQAARWALGRGPATVRQFALDFQFYVGEISNQQAQIVGRLREEIAAERAVLEAGQGGRPASPAQVQGITNRLTARSIADGGIGRGIANIDNDTGRRAIREVVLNQMGAVETIGGETVGATRAEAARAATMANLTGAYAPGAIAVGAVDETTAVARVQDVAGRINFAEGAEAAYHAHVHTLEIPAADMVAGSNEVERYLNTARETIRSGTHTAPQLMQNGNWSITFSRGQGDVIVGVTQAGDVSITTYIPAIRR